MKIKNENNTITNEFEDLYNNYIRDYAKTNNLKLNLSFKDYFRTFYLSLFVGGSIIFMLIPFALLSFFLLSEDQPINNNLRILLFLLFVIPLIISIIGWIVNLKTNWYTNIINLYKETAVWTMKSEFEENQYKKNKRNLLNYSFESLKDNFPEYSDKYSMDDLKNFVSSTSKFKNFTGFDYLEFKSTFGMAEEEFALFCITLNAQVKEMLEQIDKDNAEYEEQKRRKAEIINNNKKRNLEDTWVCDYCGNLNSGKDLRCPHCMGVRKKIV